MIGLAIITGVAWLPVVPSSGPIQAGWHSAMWVVEQAGEGFVRFRNRWNSQYIHVENGRLEAGAAQPGRHSAM